MTIALQNRQILPWHQAESKPDHHNAAFIKGGTPAKVSWTPTVRAKGEPYDVLCAWQSRSGIIDEYIALDIALCFPSEADLRNCNGFGFAFQQLFEGRAYNGGMQADFAARTWRVFQRDKWVDLHIPVAPIDFLPGQVTRLTMSYQRISTGLRYLNLCVNGLNQRLNYLGLPIAKDGVEHTNYGWQLTSKGEGEIINLDLYGYDLFTFTEA